jgi:hypothetical protein
MKRALINSLEPGRICEIVEAGNEFEVAATLSWIDCPDDATTMDTHDAETGEIVKFDILKTPGIENAYKVARTIGYKPIGDQLDMLFKELQATGTISAEGPWAYTRCIDQSSDTKRRPSSSSWTGICSRPKTIHKY